MNKKKGIYTRVKKIIDMHRNVVINIRIRMVAGGEKGRRCGNQRRKKTESGKINKHVQGHRTGEKLTARAQGFLLQNTTFKMHSF